MCNTNDIKAGVLASIEHSLRINAIRFDFISFHFTFFFTALREMTLYVSDGAIAIVVVVVAIVVALNKMNVNRSPAGRAPIIKIAFRAIISFILCEFYF